MISSIEAQQSNQIGQELYQLISELYPICRSITGNGFRETLKIIKQYIALQVHELPTAEFQDIAGGPCYAIPRTGCLVLGSST